MTKLYTMHGLMPDESYIVQVRARGIPNSTADSEWSTSLILNTSGDTTAPNAPTSLTYTENNGDFWCAWVAPTENEDASAMEDFRDYKVDIYDSGVPGTKITRYTDETSIYVGYAWLVSEFSGITNVGVDVYSRDANGNTTATAISVTGAVGADPFNHGTLAGLSDFTTDHGTDHDTHDHSAAMSTVVIDDIFDVDTTTIAPSGGNYLAYDLSTSKWEPLEAPTFTLAELTDTDLTTTAPTDQQALIYDTATTKWIPGSVASGGGGGGGPSLTYSEIIGDGAASQFFVTHSLGTSDVSVSIMDTTGTYDVVTDATVEIFSDNTVKITFDTVPATDGINVVVFGSGGPAPLLMYTETIGDDSTTSFEVTHSLGTEDIVVHVKTTSGYATGEDPKFFEPSAIYINDSNNVTVDFTVAPPTDGMIVSVGVYTNLATLSNFTDVDLTGIQDGDVLQYDAVEGKFYPVAQAAASGGASIGLIIALGG